MACRNFVQLCMEGYYNGTIFHRIIKGNHCPSCFGINFMQAKNGVLPMVLQSKGWVILIFWATIIVKQAYHDY